MKKIATKSERKKRVKDKIIAWRKIKLKYNQNLKINILQINSYEMN